MVAPKKRITTELLHIALVITLLRGNHRQIELYDNIISSNFFNDVQNDNILIEGQNWAFARTNYHRFYTDPGIEQFKSLSSDFNPYGDSGYYSDSPNDNDYDEQIEEAIYRQQSRLLLLSQLNSGYIQKDAPRFQDITAYLVSDTTTEISPSPLGVPPVVQSSSSSGGNNNSTGLPSSAHSPSTSIDSGHEDSGDESTSRNSISESEESDWDLIASVLESEGPAVSSLAVDILDSFDHELESRAAIGKELINPPSPNGLLNADLNSNLEVGSIDADEFFQFIINNNEDAEALGAAALPTAPSTIGISTEPGELLWENSSGPSLLSDVFDLGQFENNVLEQEEHQKEQEQHQNENMEWELATEEAHLSFYKEFNEVAQSDLLRAVPLQEIEGGMGSDDESETVDKPMDTDSDKPKSDEDDDSLVPELRGEGESTGAGEGNDDVSTLFDEFWETDSGFDFLESPPASSEQITTFEFNHLDSLESDSIDEESEVSDSETNMIQAAPMHANGRPTSHAAQPRGFQVHARMPGLLRGGSMDQRWQELTSLLSLQQVPYDGNGGPLPPSLTHPFGPHAHHHHHLHHGPPPLHHHPMHHPPFSGGPPVAPYNTDSARSVLLQNATLPPPDLNSSASSYTGVSMGPPPNVGSAVTSSMHLTNSSDPMIDPSTHYKMIEPSHDMIYYPNASNTEMNNQTTEGFLSSILNDDDLQLMDMAMNEGMYTMRMLDNGVGGSNSGAASIAHGPQPNLPHGPCPTIGSGAIPNAEDRMEASSDSAVSSMGSERVPPMTDPAGVSDNEWVDPDTHPHSSHDSSPYSLDYSGGKIRGYDYYGKDRGVAAPVAQKKHHMFGKRFQQEQGGQSYVLPHPSGLPLHYQSGGLHSNSSLDALDMKYGCSLEFSRHQQNDMRNGLGSSVDAVHNNHTYSLPPSHSSENNPLTNLRPSRTHVAKEKPKMNEDLDRFAEESLSRDEKRARAMSLPITTDDIINLPMDEFNERLSKYDLSEPQLALIRDIRRRGKNKVAAQNCRKRKLDQILQLADEVQRIRERKQSLLRDQQELTTRRNGLKDRYSLLYRHVFQALRDSDGNPYSPYDYSLQQAADGNIILVPRNASQPSSSDSMHHPSTSSRRDKSKDDYKKGE